MADEAWLKRLRKFNPVKTTTKDWQTWTSITVRDVKDIAAAVSEIDRLRKRPARKARVP